MSCPICERGVPLGVVAERPTTWITSEDPAATRGFAHVYARYRGDRFAGGPLDSRRARVANVSLDELRDALA